VEENVFERCQVSLILYDSRSGSTFLSSLLDQYEKVLLLPENSALYNIYLDKENLYDTKIKVKKLLDSLYSEKQFEELGIDYPQLENRLNQMPQNKLGVFNVILSVYFNIVDISSYQVVLKIPTPYSYLDDLREVLPTLKIIHLVRDGRAVFYSKTTSKSLTKRPFEKNLLVAARGWKSKIRVAEDYQGPIIHVRYEDLTSDNDATINAIFDFLNVAKADRSKKQDASSYFEKIGPEQRAFHQNITKDSKQVAPNKYLKKLSSAKISLYEMLNREVLERYGYTMHRKKMTVSEAYLKPFLLMSYYGLHFVASRTMIVYYALKEGTFSQKLQNKLVNWGVKKLQVTK
jgi:hypothetical protein